MHRKEKLPGTDSLLNFTQTVCESEFFGVKDTSNRATLGTCFTKLGTFSPLTDTMISRLPCPARDASTKIEVNIMCITCVFH